MDCLLIFAGGIVHSESDFHCVVARQRIEAICHFMPCMGLSFESNVYFWRVFVHSHVCKTLDSEKCISLYSYPLHVIDFIEIHLHV